MKLTINLNIMKAINLKGKEIDLKNLKGVRVYNLLNEENFKKIKEGNVADKEGAFFEDYSVNNTIIRKTYPTFLSSGFLTDLEMSYK